MSDDSETSWKDIVAMIVEGLFVLGLIWLILR